MLIFDSNSGPKMKGYIKVANLFPDHHFILNNGSRQPDSQSCITDSFELLTRVFSIKRLGDFMQNKIAPYDEVLPKRPTKSKLNLQKPTADLLNLRLSRQQG